MGWYHLFPRIMWPMLVTWTLGDGYPIFDVNHGSIYASILAFVQQKNTHLNSPTHRSLQNFTLTAILCRDQISIDHGVQVVLGPFHRKPGWGETKSLSWKCWKKNKHPKFQSFFSCNHLFATYSREIDVHPVTKPSSRGCDLKDFICSVNTSSILSHGTQVPCAPEFLRWLKVFTISNRFEALKNPTKNDQIQNC